MVTIKVKENSKQAKKFLEYVKTLSFVEFEEKRTPKIKKEKFPSVPQSKLKPHVLKTFEDIDAGKNIITTTSHEDLMEKLFS